MTLENLTETAYKFASHYLVGTKDALMPIVVLNRGEENDIIGLPFSNEKEKKEMILNVALEVAKKGCTSWSFMSESWFAHSYRGDPDKRRPVDRPDRKEGVFCLLSDGKEVKIRSWEIIRNPEGKCVELKVYDANEGAIESWIAVAINRAKKLHEEFDL